MTEAGTKDNRLFERFAVELPVQFSGDSDKSQEDILLQDVSTQGAQLVSKKRFFRNDYVSLEIKLPDSQAPVTIYGQVAWINAIEPNTLWKVGLHFEDVDVMKLHHLCQFAGASGKPLEPKGH